MAPASFTQQRIDALQLLIALTALLSFAAPPSADAQNTATSDRNTVAVTGTVYDSLAGEPLSGALVQVVAKGAEPKAWSATTDANGVFEIGGIPRGHFLVGFLHPALDSLGLSVAPHALEVNGDAPAQLALAIPSAQTIRRLICTETTPADSTGLLLGFIRDADTGAPLAGATAVVMWTEIVVEKSIHTDRQEVPVKSNRAGWYAVCGLPSGGPITARAEMGTDASGYIEVSVPPSGVVHRDFNIPRGAAAVAVSDGAERGAGLEGAPLRHGSARLSGVVRNENGQPLGGARLKVWGSDITGSTRDDGTFTLSGLPAGTQALEARYVSYLPKRVTVDLASNQQRSVDITLDEHTDLLEQVTVYGRASKRRSDITGFLERRKQGSGHFMTRADIAALGPFEFTDILRRMPGIKLVASTAFDYKIMSTRTSHLSNGNCEPTMYLDGVQLYDDTAINGMLSPSDIAGIEVYSGPSAAPPQYSNGLCGSILIWTGPDISSTSK